VCFPIEGESNSAFSIQEIFGRPIRGACPVSQYSDTGQLHFQLSPAMNIDPPPTSLSDNQAHYILPGTPLIFLTYRPSI
jgi:hypothetical protein